MAHLIKYGNNILNYGNNLLWQEPYNEKSLLFDGVDENLTCSGKYDNGTSGTISIWFRASAVTDLKRLFSVGGDSSASRFALQIDTLAGNKVLAINYTDTSGGNVCVARGSTTLIVNTWYNAIWSGSGSTYVLTLNGVNETLSIGSGSNHGKWIGALEPSITLANPFTTIACGRSSASYNQFFNGYVDEVSTWNSVLTSGQKTELYNIGKPKDLTLHSAYGNLINHWRMGEGSSYVGSTLTIPDIKGTSTFTGVNMESGDVTTVIP